MRNFALTAIHPTTSTLLESMVANFTFGGCISDADVAFVEVKQLGDCHGLLLQQLHLPGAVGLWLLHHVV